VTLSAIDAERLFGGNTKANAVSVVADAIPDSIHTAPGWRILGDDFYTCVPQAHMPIDKTVLRAIHSFDPGLIPMWRKQMFLPPGSVKPMVVTHYALGRRVRDPHGAYALLRVEMPRDAKHPKPNLLEVILENQDNKEGGPGSHVKFNMGLYHFLRKQYTDAMTAKEINRKLEAAAKRKLEAKQKALDELAYRQKQLQPFITKMLERSNIQDFREYQARARRGYKAKPFVQL